MGQSDSPGWFFWIAVGCATGAWLTFDCEISMWHWALAAISVITAFACFVAVADCSDVDCPNCHTRTPIKPWSF
jgi:hypothetical protein